ncbi:MAG: DUF302 domain-containing protein [Campylobacteraceae bacterium]|nr:DUF302 domain-containing protein [Campylobacteraceae bacterium]
MIKYTVSSNKTVAQLAQDIETNAKEFQFGVLHTHNIKQTLISKGKEFQNECLVLDICNANYAIEILDFDMEMSMILPCKISIYEKEGKVLVSMVKITKLIPLLNKDLEDKAKEIEKVLLNIINISL